MVHQLILNTLMACQPKVPAATSAVVDAKQVPESIGSSDVTEVFPSTRDGDPPWPSTLPAPIGLDRLRTFKPTDIQLQHFSSRVLLSDLSYYNLEFYEQSEGNPEQVVCERMCDLNPDSNAGPWYLNDIEDCEMDLIENWKEVVGAVHEQGREELLPQLGVQVGVVQCSGGLIRVMFGRAATTPAQYQTLEDDWGGYFARLAQEEATAVFAFTELLDHLQRWEAPASLQDWCEQIIDEERVHALMMSGLAHRNGQQSAVVQFPEVNRVSMKEMAMHNALTGCIGETWSAVLLRYQAEHAPKYNGVFKRIAKDETSHAEFSWALHEWLMSQLMEDQQEEVTRAMRDMLSSLPEYRYAEEIGEMNPKIFDQAWHSFSEQVGTILVA